MPTSDLQLQRLGLRPLAHLPNREGFTFSGMLRDGTFVDCHIAKDPDTQLCTVAGAAFADLVGWK